MRYILFSDGYHETSYVGEDHTTGSIDQLMKIICSPHDFQVQLNYINSEEVWVEDGKLICGEEEIDNSNIVETFSTLMPLCSEDFEILWKCSEKKEVWGLVI